MDQLSLRLPLAIQASTVDLHLCWHQSLIDFKPHDLISLSELQSIHSNDQVSVSHGGAWRLLKAARFQKVLCYAIVVLHLSEAILKASRKDHLGNHNG